MDRDKISMRYSRTKGPGYKYMQCLDSKIYRKLQARARPLGISVQELMRVKIIPEFLFGPVELNPQLVKKMLKAGMFKNGTSRKVSGTRHLPKKA